MAKHDNQVKTLLSAVESKIQALGTRPRDVLATNGIYKTDSNHYNLNTINDIETAIFVYSLILSRYKSLVEAAKELGINSIDPDICGYKLADWKYDFLHRVEVIKYDNAISALKANKKSLEELVSEDLKTEIVLAELALVLLEE